MRIYERNDYGLDEIINQIKTDFGFIYTKDTETSGYILLGEETKLMLEFDRDDTLNKASIVFPSNTVDITVGNIKAEVYASSIEASLQIVDLIKQMTGEEGYNEEDRADQEADEGLHIKNDEIGEENG